MNRSVSPTTMERKAKAGRQTMSPWPHPHDVGLPTVKRIGLGRFRTIDGTFIGQDRVEAGRKIFGTRSMRCRHETGCYCLGAPRVVHDRDSPFREAATSSGVMHAALTRDFAKYLTDDETETATEVGQQSIGRATVSLQCLTHRLRRTGHGPDWPVAAPSGSSE
jgi:hypothetical protein